VLATLLQPAKDLLDLLAPLRCAGCAAHGASVCSRCRALISEAVMLRRARHGDVPAIAALGAYEGELRRVVLHAKFRNASGLARELGAMLGAKLQTRADCIVPVPLHPGRLHLRGYNQSEDIALGIADALGALLVTGGLRRVFATRPQRELRLEQRRLNVAGAFALGPQSAELGGKAVLLVDDVLTTGATIAACACALRRASPGSVSAAVLSLKG
jgi:ComF family protein